MRLVILIALAVACGAVFAQQTLGPGYFLFNNVSVASGSDIVVVINTTQSVSLVVINSSALDGFQDGQHVTEFYNSTVGSGVYMISVPAGNYSVTFEVSKQAQITTTAFSAEAGTGHVVGLNPGYTYNFALSNYSNVSVSIASESNFSNNPLFVNISGYNFSLDSNSSLELLNFSLNRGPESLYLKSARPTDVFVSLSVANALVQPLYDINGSSPLSIGVASYGLYNDSGRITPYQISTDQIVGLANISSMNAHSLNTSGNVSSGGASMQLNIELNTYADGKLNTYWLQNVADFNTSNDTMYFVDNIWNDTLPDAPLSNSTFIGNGNVTSCGSCQGRSFYGYQYPSGSLAYSFPLAIKLLIQENQTAGSTILSFGYQLLRDGSLVARPVYFYDRVTMPGTYNSTLLVTPYYQTPTQGSTEGNYYDAEFVFGGEANGAASIFTRMDALMWLYYEKNGSLYSFPSAYIFGLDTSETAENLNTVQTGEGGMVMTGVPDYSRSILIPNSTMEAAGYVENTSKYTAATSTYTTVAYGNSGVAGQAPISTQYLWYAPALLVAVLIIILIYAVLRKRA